jgi:RNA polymerase sigma factor (sigma-70 family)
MKETIQSKPLESLWEDCLHGNRVAQAQLYQLTSSKMFGVCLRYASNHEDAAEMLQLGFIKVFTRMDQYMVNTAISYLRERKPFENSEDVWEMAADENLGGSAYDQLAHSELLEIIRYLPERYRMVFNMYVIEGYSHKEIAELLGIQEGTSKSQLLRAREWLQKKLTILEGGRYGIKQA